MIGIYVKDIFNGGQTFLLGSAISGSVNLNLFEPVNTFNFEYTSPNGTQLVGVDNKITITIGGVPILVGYAEDIRIEDTPDGINYSVSGRSITADLADSSNYKISSDKYSLSTIVDVINSIIQSETEVISSEDKPNIRLFDTDSIDQNIPGLFDAVNSAINDEISRFRFVRGEDYIETLTRAARLKKFMVYSHLGSVLVTPIGQMPTQVLRNTFRPVISNENISMNGESSNQARLGKLVANKLERGVNVLSSTKLSNSVDNFRDYFFYAQGRSTDNNNRKNSSQINGETFSVNQSRFRRVVASIEASKNVEAQAAAEYEAAIRSDTVDKYTVVSIGYETGIKYLPYWVPNIYVDYTNSLFGLKDERMLVSRVNYNFGPSEPMVTELELFSPSMITQLGYSIED